MKTCGSRKPHFARPKDSGAIQVEDSSRTVDPAPGTLVQVSQEHCQDIVLLACCQHFVRPRCPES